MPRAFRLFVVPIVVSLTSYSFGFTLGAHGFSYWLILSGALAWLASDVGAGLLADFSEYRIDPGSKTYAGRFENPLLALKAGWALFLIAFFFVLIGFLSLAERGGALPILSALGLGSRYAWVKARSWNLAIGIVGWTLLPFLSSYLISR